MSMMCPCCGACVDAPAIEQIITGARISSFQETILRTLWKAKGKIVKPWRLYDAMYADDPDGGPDHNKSRAAAKEAIFRIRQKLAGTGVEIYYDRTLGGYGLSINNRVSLHPREGEVVLDREDASLRYGQREEPKCAA